MTGRCSCVVILQWSIEQGRMRTVFSTSLSLMGITIWYIIPQSPFSLYQMIQKSRKKDNVNGNKHLVYNPMVTCWITSDNLKIKKKDNVNGNKHLVYNPMVTCWLTSDNLKIKKTYLISYLKLHLSLWMLTTGFPIHTVELFSILHILCCHSWTVMR